MNARSLFLTLSVVILATIHLAAAQQPEKVPRIGLLMSASTSEAAAFIEAFRQGLRELGYVEGKNLVLEIRGGEAKPDRLSDLAAELVRLKVNIIVTGGSLAIRAAKEATHVIPIVMVTGSDPVETGLVASLARPGGNITGLTHITTELMLIRLFQQDTRYSVRAWRGLRFRVVCENSSGSLPTKRPVRSIWPPVVGLMDLSVRGVGTSVRML